MAIQTVEATIADMIFAKPRDGEYGIYASTNTDFESVFGDITQDASEAEGAMALGFASTDGPSITFPDAPESNPHITWGKRQRRSRAGTQEDFVTGTFTLDSLLTPAAWSLNYETETHADGSLAKVDLNSPVSRKVSIAVDIEDEETGRQFRLYGRGNVFISGDVTAGDEDASAVEVTLEFNEAARIIASARTNDDGQGDGEGN